MKNLQRRRFLQTAAAAAASVSPPLRALAAVASFKVTGKIVWSPVDVGFIGWVAQFRALRGIHYCDAVNLETHWAGAGTTEASSKISWAGMKKALLKANE